MTTAHQTLSKLLKLLEKRFFLSGDELLIHHASNSPKVTLDVGCGKGNLMRSLLNLNRPKFQDSNTVGLDIFLPYLLRARGIYNDVVQCDVRFLPIKDASCDIIIANQIIEHLKKNDGFKLIKALEKILRETIIITLPVSYNPKKHLEDDNPWQAHLSSWHPDEFKERGFKVYGYSGARFLRGERGLFKIKSKIITPFLFVLSLFTQLITYKLVTASYQMLCIKRSFLTHPKIYNKSRLEIPESRV